MKLWKCVRFSVQRLDFLQQLVSLYTILNQFHHAGIIIILYLYLVLAKLQVLLECWDG